MMLTNKTMLSVLFQKLHPNAKLPTKAHEHGDAGFDLVCPVRVVLPRGKVTVVPTGLQVAKAPVHTEAYLDIRSRSGLAKKLVFPVTGTVDLNYRGEISVVMANLSDDDYVVEAGDRIAQMVIQKIMNITGTSVGFGWTDTVDTESSARGSGGFGSTGK